MANNPAIPVGFTGYEPELQDITRQREMAKMLLQQGMNQNDMQGQMVSGRFVGASPWQGIAKLYQAYSGRELTKEADRKQAELIEALRKAGVQESKDILALARGTPEQTTYGAGAEGPTMSVTPATAPDLEAAYTKAIGGRSPQAQALAGLLSKQLMREPKWEMKGIYNEKTGATDLYQYDANATDPMKTMKKVGTEKPALSAKDVAELRDKGIALPFPAGGQGGGGGGGVSYGGGSQVAVPTGDRKFMPSTAPIYQDDPNLTPEQNRKLKGEFATEYLKNVKNAKNTFELLKDASGILNTGTPSSGRLENIVTGTREFFGGGGETSVSDQKLNMIAGALTMAQPRFEGPQGVLDVKLYEKLAGDLGNPNLPIASRLGAVQQMIRLQQKYYPNGDWASIDVSGPVKTNQTFFKGSETMSPEKFKQGLKPQDQEAFDWARRNPNDPRATEIKKRLGFQ